MQLKTKKAPETKPGAKAESVLEFVAREGIGRVESTPEMGTPFWYRCVWCWKREDKYQDLRKHAREIHGWGKAR